MAKRNANGGVSNPQHMAAAQASTATDSAKKNTAIICRFTSPLSMPLPGVLMSSQRNSPCLSRDSSPARYSVVIVPILSYFPEQTEHFCYILISGAI